MTEAACRRRSAFPQELRISGLGMNGGWKAFFIKPSEAEKAPAIGFPRLQVCHVALNVMQMGFQRCVASTKIDASLPSAVSCMRAVLSHHVVETGNRTARVAQDCPGQ